MDGFALSVDRAAFLDGRSFASSFTDHTTNRLMMFTGRLIYHCCVPSDQSSANQRCLSTVQLVLGTNWPSTDYTM